jgi:uncharacterized membrane protein
METERDGDDAPTVVGSYAHAWDTLKAQLGPLLLIFLLYAILHTPASFAQGPLAEALSGLYQVLVSGPLAFGISWVALVAIRGQRPEVSDLFAPFQRRYLAALIASLLLPMVLAIAALPGLALVALAGLGEGASLLMVLALGLMLLLPLYAAVRLTFVPYLLIEERLGPIEALGESWERTGPVQLQIAGIELLAIPLLICGFLLFVVGIVPAMILVALALATIYDDVSAETELEAEDPDGPSLPVA